MLELVFTMLGVEQTVLQRAQLQCELRAKLLQPDDPAFVVEDVAVLSEEDKVALVVEGGDPPPAELRLLVEETGQHATDALTETRVEIVQDHFGLVRRHFACALFDNTHQYNSLTSGSVNAPEYLR